MLVQEPHLRARARLVSSVGGLGSDRFLGPEPTFSRVIYSPEKERIHAWSRRAPNEKRTEGYRGGMAHCTPARAGRWGVRSSGAARKENCGVRVHLQPGPMGRARRLSQLPRERGPFAHSHAARVPAAIPRAFLSNTPWYSGSLCCSGAQMTHPRSHTSQAPSSPARPQTQAVGPKRKDRHSRSKMS